MSDLVNGMREERNRPAVLAHSVLRIRSENPKALVFIFEGVEDIAVYEQWLRNSSAKLIYEPVSASGKKQILQYMKSLRDCSSHLLPHVYAFIDRDFDVAIESVDNIHEINAHSFESLICTRQSLESLLLDEFKCSAHPYARTQILMEFDRIFDAAKNAMNEVNFLLFASQRTGRNIIKKPEKLSHFLSVDLKTVVAKFVDPLDVVKVDLNGIDLHALRQEYFELDNLLKYRGKYLYMIYKKWTELLFSARTTNNHELFNGFPILINAGGCSVTHRRLACAIDPPESFNNFILKIRSAK